MSIIFSVIAMISLRAVVLSAALLNICWGSNLTFPAWFKFGTATAAYQVEGGWNASDKGISVWDKYLQDHPDYAPDGCNGEVACDSYHKWQEDIDMLTALGVDFYRFSISWPRLLPSGYPNYVSEDGKNYYNNLINGLLDRGIEPVITLYHWDLPQNLQDLGGWANPLIADWFADYARVVYSLYADRVKIWITINEPSAICDVSFTGLLAPAVVDSLVGSFLCNKNVLMAHAKAWRIYDREYKPLFEGKVSLANHMFWFEPATSEEVELTEHVRQYMVGRFSHAIFSDEGGWPADIERIMAENSKKQGYPRSRLPAFTRQEIEFIKGTYDFYGVNHYTSKLVRKARPGEVVGPWPFEGAPELGVVLDVSPDWEATAAAWLMIYPEGLRSQLRWLKQQYGDIEILITESGYSDSGGQHDDVRIHYYEKYLEQVLLSIYEDNVKVIGYTAWSLMDNYEWFDGYKTKFGLYHVDFNDPNRRRTPKKSAHYYARVIAQRSLNVY